MLTGTFDLSSFETLTQIATLTAGAIVLMWIGELITERGIGNGISFIIFAGIVSRAPGALGAFFAHPNITLAIAFGLVAIAAVAVIIYIQEGQRRIPIQYASRVRGRRMYRAARRSCRCGSTRPASSRSSSPSASCSSRTSWRPTSRPRTSRS